jgi:hypothetical protein
MSGRRDEVKHKRDDRVNGHEFDRFGFSWQA